MDISNLELPEDLDAIIDTAKKRVEIQFKDDSKGQIVIYYPIENLQVYCYSINGNQFPDMRDMNLRANCHGRFLRVLICEHGYGEFFEKSVKYNMSGGEFGLKFGTGEKNRFCFAAEDLVGIELVLHLDGAVQESVLLKMLQTSFHTLGFSCDDFQINQWYFSDYSKKTRTSLDRLIENCMGNEDPALILINVAELGYNLGNDYRHLEPKAHKYPTNLQKAIAEDIHTMLTEEYYEHRTATALAERYGISDTTIKRYFKNVYGYSFKEYQIKVRMEKAAEFLLDTDLKVAEIAQKTGYLTHGKFISTFKAYYGATPSEYRRIHIFAGLQEYNG